jgi:hypothetical protein
MAEKIFPQNIGLNQFRNRTFIDPTPISIDVSPMMESINSLQEKIDGFNSKIDLTNSSISNITQVIPPSNAIDPKKWYSNKEIPTRITDSTFMLSKNPDLRSEHLYLNGILIKDGDIVDYTMDGNTIVFSENIPEKFKIHCTYYYTYDGPSKGQAIREVPIGNTNGINKIYSIKSTPSQGTEHVYLNGILQEKNLTSDYTLNENILTFLDAPLENSIIQVTYEYSNLPSLRILLHKEIPLGNINGKNKIFTLNYSPVENSEHIYLNGVLQERNIDYDIENNIIVLSSSLLLGDKITCTYYYYS